MKKTKRAPRSARAFSALNLSLPTDLKSDSLRLVDGLGYGISEYVAKLLEAQLIRAGKRKPVVEPVDSLLLPKKTAPAVQGA